MPTRFARARSERARSDVTVSLDSQVVAALCCDGRADVPSIADETDAVATAVQKRLQTLEDDGVIEGYAARVDYSRLGYETVILRLRVELDAVDDVTDRLRNASEFGTVYHVSGPSTVFAVGTFGDEAAVAACLRKLHADPDIKTVSASSVSSVHKDGDCPIDDR